MKAMFQCPKGHCLLSYDVTELIGNLFAWILPFQCPEGYCLLFHLSGVIARSTRWWDGFSVPQHCLVFYTRYGPRRALNRLRHFGCFSAPQGIVFITTPAGQNVD